VNYRFEQVSAHAWAAVAIDSGAAVGNAGFVDLGGRSLVVDCGYTPGAARDLRAAAEQHAGPVERLVITHGDLDHYGGAQVFADVPIIATEATKARIEEHGQTPVDEMLAGMDAYMAELEQNDAPAWERDQGRAIAAELPETRITAPTERFAGELDLGTVRVLDLGAAHSVSDSVVWLPEDRTLFSGDLVSVRGHLNLTRGFPPESWLAILDRLAELEPEHVVVGHGSPGGPEAIAAAHEYVETVVELAGVPGEHAIPTRYEGWTFPEGFRQNIDALRAR
jgi:glyoxylase-like metal-dependent hydrolase (beta-lactamase superfamily II)